MNENLRAAAQHAEWLAQFLNDAKSEVDLGDWLRILVWIADSRHLVEMLNAMIEAKG